MGWSRRKNKMLIKIRCTKCGFTFEVSEQEFVENDGLYHSCIVCYAKTEVINLEEIVHFDIERTVKNNVDKWFKSQGIEGTIEMIERNKDNAVGRLYIKELRQRGFNIKEDKMCNHSFVDCDNDGFYGYEVCRFCGLKRHK